MKAICIREAVGIDGLELQQVTDPPSCGPDQVMVRVRAVGVNRADILQSLGRYPAPPGVVADIPGLEYAGEIESMGSDVSGFNLGDRVMGLVAGGAYAERVLIHYRTLLAIPQAISFEEAAAIPEAFMTAYDGLFVRGALESGERVLIHAFASGVGTAAVQLARWAGCEVIGTSRSPEKVAMGEKLGASGTVLVQEQSFAKAVSSEFGEVDVTLDLVGGPYVDESLKCLRSQGRIVVVGLLAGTHHSVNFARLLGKRATVVGTVLRSRPLEQKIELTQNFAQRVLPAFEDGQLKAQIAEVKGMGMVREALKKMATNQTVGKLVLTW